MAGVSRKAISDPTTHYGNGRAATRLFFVQRLTGMANLLFLLFLGGFVVALAGEGREAMVGAVRNPLVALPLALMLVNVPVHMAIGMREVIEDYVHQPGLNRFCLMLNTFAAFVISAIGLGSVAILFFGG